jgi:ATP-dependent Clp protease adaptor protein ClpS
MYDEYDVFQEVQSEIRLPKLYQVVLLNDDYTPMEFVVQILQSFFHMQVEKAKQLMLEVHNKGQAICGIFSYDVAETKVLQINDYSRNHDYPLLCILEPD